MNKNILVAELKTRAYEDKADRRITRSKAKNQEADSVRDLDIDKNGMVAEVNKAKKRKLHTAPNETVFVGDLNIKVVKRRNGKSRRFTPSILCLKPALQMLELIWAHVRGYSNWPGVIERETSKGKYKIHFFGDYTTADVSKNKISHVMEGFVKFSEMKKPSELLKKAISETQLCVFDENRTSCPICDMMSLKRVNN